MHLMIDLETMGTRPNAPVIAVGAVLFTPDKIGREFYANIDLSSSVKDGGAVIDPGTVMWWMAQSNEARGALQRYRKDITTVLMDFSAFLKDEDITGVWGNGASFDNVLLAETYRRMHMTPPWDFWCDRCYRTVKNMFPAVRLDRSGTHHNALDDAKTQAAHLLKINDEFGKFL